MKKITGKAIAEMAGVSPAAVSLALSGKPGVSDSVRKQILDLALQYGYQKVSVKQPVLRANSNIAFIIFETTGDVVNKVPFASMVQQGIEEEAKRLGYNVLVYHYRKGSSAIEQFPDLIKKVAGAIIMATEIMDDPSDMSLLKRLQGHMPVILIDCPLKNSGFDTITTDNIGGTYLAVEYLLKHGHSDIGVITCKERILNFDYRSMGIERAVRDNPEVQFQKIEVPFNNEEATNVLVNWIKNTEKIPTAYVAESDLVAFGAMQAFARCGYRIPEDVSIIGFDDLPYCEFTVPPLTSVHVPKTEMGRIAMQITNSRINGYEPMNEDDRGITCDVSLATLIKERDTVLS